MKTRCNRGSAIVEVTMIMSLILMVLFLLLTMLLGGWQQAQAHADLMLLTDRSKNMQEEVKCEQTNDRIIYQKKTHLELIKGYSIDKTEYQIERQTAAEEKLRRWQLIGDTISDGGIPTVCDSAGGEH